METAICYEVYYRDYKNKKAEIIGALMERRKDVRRRSTLLQSALNWARKQYGQHVKDANAIYILRKELSAE